MPKVNLGCGQNYLAGYINCDNDRTIKTDKCFDLLEGLPFDDDFADEILAECVLQQIGEDFLMVMNELWRVLKPKGVLIAEVPLAPCSNAFQDPMDVRYFTRETFTYLKYDHRRYEEYGKGYGFLPWKVEKLDLDIHADTDWGRLRIKMSPVRDHD